MMRTEHVSNDTQVCAACGSMSARLTTEAMAFSYGDKASPVELVAQVPVWQCDACGVAYTAEGAEEAEREAICAYLHRLTPREIVELRRATGLTQEAFAAALGVGRVTVARWETGQQLQSAVYDGLIRRLAAERSRRPKPAPRFRTIVEHRREAREHFELVLA